MADHHVLESSDKAALRRRPSTSAEGPQKAIHPLLRLQSQVGNAQIARLLAQRAAKPEEEEDKGIIMEVRAQHDLTQRAAPEDEKVQAKHETVGVEGGPVGPDTASQIDSMRGSGASLEEGTRTSMEAALGASFADVRVHSGKESDTLNRRLTARAFTTGSDIFLRGDSSPSDSRLMAHELTHVVQQRSMSGTGSDGMRVGAAGDSHEAHADAVANTLSASTQAPATAQRAGAEDEQLQAQHDLAQREGAEEEE